jgi:hypothetical protein
VDLDELLVPPSPMLEDELAAWMGQGVEEGAGPVVPGLSSPADDLASVAGHTEGDAARALLGHAAVHIEKIPGGEQARLRSLVPEPGPDRVPVGSDDGL